jgi:hypothetical protein
MSQRADGVVCGLSIRPRVGDLSPKRNRLSRGTEAVQLLTTGKGVTGGVVRRRSIANNGLACEEFPRDGQRS